VITIPDCQTTKKIYESDNTLVYRARRNQNNLPVILKILKEDYPAPEEIARYKQEYEATCSLNLKGVVKAHGLERYENTFFIIFEDIGAESLDILMDDKKFTMNEFLAIAIKTVESLGEIHAQNIIHKDINPSNIIFNPETGQLQIIDFGISTILPHQNPALKNPEVIEGTLSYISPEQTGRMNRAIDYRTDFYSLGATFYELLLQKTLFNGTDSMELVHCHMARKPEPPYEVNQEIPKVVSDIVMKLLAKSAENRYQSAGGIKADLEECLNELDVNGNIPTFPLGRNDITDRFQIPQKLYGREQELGILKTTFERVSEGKSEMLLISGRPGIGKTALVQEMYMPVTQQRGYFISGKFDQFQRNIPYSAVINAFQDFVRQLLAENEEKLNCWRKKILKALGPNGQVIIDVIPEVELIIGPQPPVTELSPAETKNRFDLVFQNFIRVFTRPEHPLVLFLDDLQWVDTASLKLIRVFMEASGSRHLLLIGAYREMK
jgi:serine/threonine protein kinase